MPYARVFPHGSFLARRGAEEADQRKRRILRVELLAVDLKTCARCVPTGKRLEAALGLLREVAEALGIELEYSPKVVASRDEALRRALRTSPTIRLNGRDIDPEVAESACESCGRIAGGALVNCREWRYRGKTYSAAPLSLLLESLMSAMLHLDALPLVQPEPLAVLPESLEVFFAATRGGEGLSCGSEG
jgi:hypothetical protein